jgi:hypothetical protein
LERTYQLVMFRDVKSTDLKNSKEFESNIDGFFKSFFLISELAETERPDFVFNYSGRKIEVRLDTRTKLDLVLLAHQKFKAELEEDKASPPPQKDPRVIQTVCEETVTAG